MTTVKIDNQEGFATLTIDRPKALNAINHEVMSELHEFFETGHRAIEDLKGVIITGSGEKAFAAGADIKGLQGLNIDKGIALSKFGHETYDMIECFDIPVIAAVNGFALGGGCELAMACHLRIASENAMFGLPETKLGLIPGYGGTQRLIQLVGKGRALELMMTADMIDANRSYEIGLTNKVVSSEDLLPTAMKMMSKIASRGPKAIKYVINAANAYFDKERNGFEYEYTIFGKLLTTNESKIGIEAFLKKEKPNFRQ